MPPNLSPTENDAGGAQLQSNYELQMKSSALRGKFSAITVRRGNADAIVMVVRAGTRWNLDLTCKNPVVPGALVRQRSPKIRPRVPI